MPNVQNQLRLINRIYLILTLTSLLLPTIYPDYRDMFGTVSSAFHFILASLPDVAMSLIFALLLSGIQKMKRSAIISGMVVSIVFSLLSVAMFIPFIGFFFAGLTPFLIVYFFVVVLLPKKIFAEVSIVVCIVFFILNIYAFSLGRRLLASIKDSESA